MKDKGISKEVIDILKKSVTREIKEIVKHMESDEWDLSFDHIKGECLEPLTSCWFEWYIMSKICEKGYELKFVKNEITDTSQLVVTKPKRKKKTNGKRKS